MKISETWLREWVDAPASAEEIAERLVMGGLELEIEPVVAEVASGVVVGRIVSLTAHPDAERLRVCQVDVGAAELRQIVCGAPNAREGLVAPCALPGARLPGGIKIDVGKLRGVESAGMLCSAKELGVSEASSGLMELDASAPVGAPIEDYLDLGDRVLHLELTPNRGDCLSVLGLAREVAALYDMPVDVGSSTGTLGAPVETDGLQIESPADTHAFVGQLVEGIDPAARTPDWMRERLRRSGLRPIHPLVDITNYVMLELGQPMHAYDAGQIRLPLSARRARAGERLQLLNAQWVELSDELVIADAEGPVGLAGTMGGLGSSVTEATRNVLFEAAAFDQAAVAGVGRRHRLSSDALYRFERGVDSALQVRAMRRAIELTLQICGGHPGPMQCAKAPSVARPPIALRRSRLDAQLGIVVDDREVESAFRRQAIQIVSHDAEAWQVQAPSWRHDLAIEADLIEEVARLYGYDRIPARAYAADLVPVMRSEALRTPRMLVHQLVNRGWQEIVSLAFASAPLQRQLEGGRVPVEIDNPLADTQGELRTSLWPGLIEAWRYNRARQTQRVRLFEVGVCFELDTAEAAAGEVVETTRIAGLMAGDAWGEQWGMPRRPVDFFDLKAEVEALAEGLSEPLRYQSAAHPALHPGRSAQIWTGSRSAGWIGQLHPQLAATLEVPDQTLVFEIEVNALLVGIVPQMHAISDFPSSRRDLAVIVNEGVSAEELLEAVQAAECPTLQRAWVFDVYRGQGVSESCKSITLGLIFQDASRTLTVEEVDVSASRIIDVLAQRTGASVR